MVAKVIGELKFVSGHIGLRFFSRNWPPYVLQLRVETNKEMHSSENHGLITVQHSQGARVNHSYSYMYLLGPC